MVLEVLSKLSDSMILFGYEIKSLSLSDLVEHGQQVKKLLYIEKNMISLSINSSAIRLNYCYQNAHIRKYVEICTVFGSKFSKMSLFPRVGVETAD